MNRRSSLFRIIGLVTLAYALVLQGVLGALGGAAHAGDMRLAAQTGVICTIHGIVDASTGGPSGSDPTPGKLACVEHCVLAGAGALSTVASSVASDVALWPVPARSPWHAHPISTQPRDAPEIPPPPRGPPVLLI